MKKASILITVLLAFQWVGAQIDSIQATQNDANSLIAVLQKLEATSGYQFFYDENWLQNVPAKANISNLEVTEALNELLKDSSLNYYVLNDEKRVILIQNGIIYDALPKGFFGQSDSTQNTRSTVYQEQVADPVFYDSKGQKGKKKYPVVRVGKTDKNKQKSAYILQGRAINTRTKEVIPDLAIRVAGSNRLVVTDENGNFSIELPSGYNRIKASAMGIANTERELLIYSDATYDFEFEESLEQLEEVVVAADAVRNVKETTTGTEKIDLEESKNIPLVLGERDLLQVAKALPGISSAGEGASGLNVRGGKTDQNLVLLDDAVIYNPTHFFGLFQALNPFTTKGVEIYKGTLPVEHGGRLSSLFDIRSKDGNVEKISGEGSIGPVTGNLALEFPIKKDTSSLMIGGRGAYANYILKSLDDPALNNSSASFYDGIIKYNHKINEKNELRATAYYSKDAFSITSDSLYQYSNRLASLRWDKRISDKASSALVLQNSDYRFGIDFENLSNASFDLNYGISETGLRYKLKTTSNEKHTYEYGASAKLYNVNPGSIEPLGTQSAVIPKFIQKERAIEAALFIGDRFTVSDKFSIEGGLRYNFFAALGPKIERTYEPDFPLNDATVQSTTDFGSGDIIKTYGGLEGRFSARYLLNENSSLKASLNNAYQFIHTLSNNTTVSPIDTWKLSDFNIKPQNGYQASLGIYNNFNDNMYEFSIESYYKLLYNVTDFKTGADLLLNDNVETEIIQGEGKAYGIEMLLKKNRGDLNGWLAYTYSRSFYKFDSAFSEERINNGEYFPSNFDKPHDVSLIANYKLTKRFSFSGNFVYQTGRPVTFPVGTFRFNNADFVAFSNRNEFRIPDFFRLDLGLNIEGNHKKNKLAHSFFTISVYNVLGRNNPYSVFFVTEDGEVKALQSSIFAIPIPSITYNFKF